MSAAAAASSSASASPAAAASFDVPAPPAMPAYLAPRSKAFAGYKLESEPLAVTEIPLARPLNMDEPPAASSTPPSFLALNQKLKTNQMAILRSADATKPGAHAVYYVDHSAVWQVDPPSAQAMQDHGEEANGGSHVVYQFEALESGDGLSFVALAPCFLLLTRAGGRPTIFHVDPLASAVDLSSSLRVLFDGSPLSPAPLLPHDATISAAMITAKRDQIVIVLYEFWEEHHETGAAPAKPIQFVHEGDAMRTAGTVTPLSAPPFSAISSAKHALHKLTACQFNLRFLPGFPSQSLSPNAQSEGEPRADLVHSFSSVQNHRLPRDEVTAKLTADANFSSPLACWLEQPTQSTHRPSPSPAAAAASSPTAAASPSPFLWYVVARVPYLNETESVIYELQKREAESASAAKEDAQPLSRADAESKMDEDESSAAAAPAAAAAAAAPTLSAHPNFTSEQILSETHNLKHFAIDHEDEDDDLDEFGSRDPNTLSLNRPIDTYVQLFDPLGSLLAKRPLRQQTFLFAQVNDAPHLQRHAVIGVKQGEDLLLYAVQSAPQLSAEGLSLGAAGSVQASSASPQARVGIVLKPVFSFAGLGYVQSGKQFKKFFVEDGTHQFVILAEFARHIHVYGRPSAASDVAASYLLQLPHAEDAAKADDSRQIFGLQTTVVPIASGDAGDAAPVQGRPIMYVLARAAVRQYQLPLCTLPA